MVKFRPLVPTKAPGVSIEVGGEVYDAVVVVLLLDVVVFVVVTSVVVVVLLLVPARH